MKTISLAILLSFAIFFAIKSYNYSKSYENITMLIIQKNNLNDITATKLKKVGEILSFGLYDGHNKILSDDKKAKEVQTYYKDKNILFTRFFMITVLLLFVFYFIVDLRIFTLFLTLFSLISLSVGLFAPILMITFYKSVDTIGDITLMVQSKSVISTISNLFNSGEVVVATALFIFSIALPISKNLSLIFIAIFFKTKFAHDIVKIFKVLGKWSMADVFVVSIFLVFLSNKESQTSQAEIEIGLYFFLAYVILSILSSISADRLLHQERLSKN